MHLPQSRLVLALLLSSLFLVSCGGGGGGGSSTTSNETINGIVVPPEPDATANNATLAGVDSNSNGVRDDVERQIAKAISSQADFSKSLLAAKTYQTILTSPAPTTRAQALSQYTPLVCLSKIPGEVPKKLRAISGDTSIENLTMNTGQRTVAMERFLGKLAFVAHGEVNCGP